MRDPARIERIMNLIETIWVKYPDTRFLQLVYALKSKYRSENDIEPEIFYDKWEDGRGTITFRETPIGSELFNLEDDKFEQFLIEYVERS